MGSFQATYSNSEDLVSQDPRKTPGHWGRGNKIIPGPPRPHTHYNIQPHRRATYGLYSEGAYGMSQREVFFFTDITIGTASMNCKG